LEGLAVKNGYHDLVPDWKPKVIKDSNWIHIPRTNAGVFGHLYKKKIVLFKNEYLTPFAGRLSGYIKRRGITIDTAKKWELGVDSENKRAIFIVRDTVGRLAVVIGRDVTGKSHVKYSNYVLDRLNHKLVPFIDHTREKDFVSPMKSCFLYGEQKAAAVLGGDSDRKVNDLIVVEGAMDVLKLWQFGFNAVGVLGSYPSETQIEKLVTLVPKKSRLIIMADADDAGRKLASSLGVALGDRLSVFNAILPEGIDPGDAMESQINEAIEKSKMIGLT
jgi:DNA primase